jgi:hypothetical protein
MDSLLMGDTHGSQFYPLNAKDLNIESLSNTTDSDSEGLLDIPSIVMKMARKQ